MRSTNGTLVGKQIFVDHKSDDFGFYLYVKAERPRILKSDSTN